MSQSTMHKYLASSGKGSMDEDLDADVAAAAADGGAYLSDAEDLTQTLINIEVMDTETVEMRQTTSTPATPSAAAAAWSSLDESVGKTSSTAVPSSSAAAASWSSLDDAVGVVHDQNTVGRTPSAAVQSSSAAAASWSGLYASTPVAAPPVHVAGQNTPAKRLHTDVVLSPEAAALTTGSLNQFKLDIVQELRGQFAEIKRSNDDTLAAFTERCKRVELAVTDNTARSKRNEDHLDSLEGRMAVASASAAASVEAIQRIERQCDILIRGLVVDKLMGQHLLRTIVFRIAHAIGHELSDRDIHFVRVQQLQRAPSILVARFSNVAIRDMIFFDYLNKRINLNARQLGCSTDSRVYLTDNLTATAARVKKEARKLQEEKVIKKVTIRRGAIGVYLTSNPNRLHIVTSLEDLARLNDSSATDHTIRN